MVLVIPSLAGRDSGLQAVSCRSNPADGCSKPFSYHGSVGNLSSISDPGWYIVVSVVELSKY